MSKKIEKGFFSIETLNEMDKLALEEARAIAMEAVNAQPEARPKNIKKAKEAIVKAKSKKELMINVANFMLAHPSESLSMSKGE